MPNPNNYKDKSSFMKVCVPMVIKEGTAKDGSQGYAICQDMWAKHLKNKRAKGEQLTKEELEELHIIDLEDLKITIDKL